MDRYNETTAYDFSLFEERAPKTSAVPKPREPQKKPQVKRQPARVVSMPVDRFDRVQKQRRKKFNRKAVAGFMGMVGIAAIACWHIVGQVRVAELTNQIEEANTQLSEAESLYVEYKMKSDSSLSLENIEKYATEKLGMQKAEQGQLEYVTLSTDDKGEVVSNDSSNWFAAAWNYIVQLFS